MNAGNAYRTGPKSTLYKALRSARASRAGDNLCIGDIAAFVFFFSPIGVLYFGPQAHVIFCLLRVPVTRASHHSGFFIDLVVQRSTPCVSSLCLIMKWR